MCHVTSSSNFNSLSSFSSDYCDQANSTNDIAASHLVPAGAVNALTHRLVDVTEGGLDRFNGRQEDMQSIDVEQAGMEFVM